MIKIVSVQGLVVQFMASNFYANLNLQAAQPNIHVLKTRSNRTLNSNPFLISRKSHHYCISCGKQVNNPVLTLEL